MKAQGIIEGARIARRKEETARVHLVISVPIAGVGEHLLLHAAKNMGNPVDFELTVLQGSLIDDDDEGELETIFAGDTEGENAVEAGPESELVSSLLNGAQEPTDEEREQAMANLASEGRRNRR